MRDDIRTGIEPRRYGYVRVSSMYRQKRDDMTCRSKVEVCVCDTLVRTGDSRAAMALMHNGAFTASEKRHIGGAIGGSIIVR